MKLNGTRGIFGLLLSTALTFGVINSLRAQTLTRTFDNPRHGFNISFPEGWIEIPAVEMEAVNRSAEALHADWKRPALHYGYRMSNSNGLSWTPYVVIRVADTDHPPTPDAVTVELQKDDLPKGAVLETPVYDGTLNAVTATLRANINGNHRVECSMALFLTRKSVIKIFFYFAEADHERMVGSVQEIIKGVRVADEIKLSAPTPKSPLGLVAALLAVVVTVVVLIRAKPAES